METNAIYNYLIFSYFKSKAKQTNIFHKSILMNFILSIIFISIIIFTMCCFFPDTGVQATKTSNLPGCQGIPTTTSLAVYANMPPTGLSAGWMVGWMIFFCVEKGRGTGWGRNGGGIIQEVNTFDLGSLFKRKKEIETYMMCICLHPY